MNQWFDQYQFPKIELKNTDGTKTLDQHPIPLAHYGWVHENLCPILGKSVNEKWALKANNILFDHCTAYEKIDGIYITNLDWYAHTNWIGGVIGTNYSNRKFMDNRS
jgi:hypothetical protein